jgi:hypothetical protein
MRVEETRELTKARARVECGPVGPDVTRVRARRDAVERSPETRWPGMSGKASARNLRK